MSYFSSWCFMIKLKYDNTKLIYYTCGRKIYTQLCKELNTSGKCVSEDILTSRNCLDLKLVVCEL